MTARDPRLRVLGGYLALAAAGAAALRPGRRPSVAVPSFADTVLLGLATFKVSRLLTRAKVTEGLRAPFVESSEPIEAAEVLPEPRQDGDVRSAVGELLTCPFCTDVWIATAFAIAYAVAPERTRLAASAATSMAVADVAQYAFTAVKRIEQ